MTKMQKSRNLKSLDEKEMKRNSKKLKSILYYRTYTYMNFYMVYKNKWFIDT